MVAESIKAGEHQGRMMALSPPQHDQGVERQAALRQRHEGINVDGLDGVVEIDGEPAASR